MLRWWIDPTVQLSGLPGTACIFILHSLNCSALHFHVIQFGSRSTCVCVWVTYRFIALVITLDDALPMPWLCCSKVKRQRILSRMWQLKLFWSQSSFCPVAWSVWHVTVLQQKVHSVQRTAKGLSIDVSSRFEQKSLFCWPLLWLTIELISKSHVFNWSYSEEHRERSKIR